MTSDPATLPLAFWRSELPPLTGRTATLREPAAQDIGPLVDLLNLSDATRFGVERVGQAGASGPVGAVAPVGTVGPGDQGDPGNNDQAMSDVEVRLFIEHAARDRRAGVAFTYVIILASTRNVVGLIQVRQLDPAFEAAEWECAIAPASRGTGLFLEAVRLVGSFAFGTIGVHRLEARVPVQNGRGNGALRKLGAVQEGLLRRSMRRNDEYFDQVLWSILREDWGDHWVSIAPRVH